MATFPAGLPAGYRRAWLVCRELAAHLPGPQESDSLCCADAVVRFCKWAREDVLERASAAVQDLAESLSKQSLALKLMDVSAELFKLCSPATPRSPCYTTWDMRRFEQRRTLRSIERPLSPEQYEAAVRSHLAVPEVRAKVRAILDFDRNDLLGGIEEEFRRAASAEPPRVAARPAVDAEQDRSIGGFRKGPATSTPDCIDFLDKNRYKVGEIVKYLTFNEDCVLQAFLRAAGNAHSMKSLGKAAGIDVDACVKVLRELKGTKKRQPKYDGLFSPFITMPGTRAGGGYQVRIRRSS